MKILTKIVKTFENFDEKKNFNKNGKTFGNFDEKEKMTRILLFLIFWLNFLKLWLKIITNLEKLKKRKSKNQFGINWDQDWML